MPDRPWASRAADQGGLRREEPADLPHRERAGEAPGNRRDRRSGAPAGGAGMNTTTEAPPAITALRSKDLLGIAELSPDEINLILDTAEAMKEIGSRPIKKV